MPVRFRMGAVGSLSGNQEDGVVTSLLSSDDGSRRTKIAKPGIDKKRHDLAAIEAQVKHTRRILVERAILAVQVGQGDTATGVEKPVKLPEERCEAGHMVERHAAHDQMEVGAGEAGGVGAEKSRLHVLDALVTNLLG